MSTACKTRLEVQKILRANIMECFTTFKQEGWDVMEFANASFQRADKIVLMNFLRAEREGWQAVNYAQMDAGYTRKDEWIETQHWQLHVLLKRPMAPEEPPEDFDYSTLDESIVAEDIAQLLIAWFNGRGCDYFRKYGLANLVIDMENILVYNDDSELYQKRAVFTVKIQVPKELSTGDVPIEMIEPSVKPV